MPGGSAYQSGKLALIRFTEFINAEYGEQGCSSTAVHSGGVMTELSSGMPTAAHHVLINQPALAADTFVWLTAERRDWLASRYVSCTWDMEELVGMKDKIVQKDLLRFAWMWARTRFALSSWISNCIIPRVLRYPPKASK